MRSPKTGAFVLCAFAVCGCTQTVLTQPDRSRLEGELINSDPERRAVQMRFNDGSAEWILLESVAEAERPGTIEMLLGMGWVVGGAALLSMANDEAAHFFQLSGVAQTGGIIGLAGGLLFSGIGLSRWQTSSSHLERAGWTD